MNPREGVSHEYVRRDKPASVCAMSAASFFLLPAVTLLRLAPASRWHVFAIARAPALVSVASATMSTRGVSVDGACRGVSTLLRARDVVVDPATRGWAD